MPATSIMVEGRSWKKKVLYFSSHPMTNIPMGQMSNSVFSFVSSLQSWPPWQDWQGKWPAVERSKLFPQATQLQAFISKLLKSVGTDTGNGLIKKGNFTKLLL